MNESLTKAHLDVLLESLKHTQLRFEEYQGYLSSEFKQKRIHEIESVASKIRRPKKAWID